MIRQTSSRLKVQIPLFIAISIVLFANLGATPLTDIDEGAFSEATREMWARKDFLSPWLLDMPRFDKPVLIHWLQMLSMLTFGFNSFAARLPSALAGLFWIYGIAFWAKAVHDEVARVTNTIPPDHSDQAFQWALILSAFNVGIPAMSRSATADALLNACICWAMYFAFRSITCSSAKDAVRLGRCASFFIGLGMLAKGPIAILIPGVSLVIGVLTLRAVDLRCRFKLMLRDRVSWVITIAIPGPWYLLQYQAHGSDFLHTFFGAHNVGRFTNTMHDFSGGFYYYPVWLSLALLPFATLILRALISSLREGLLWSLPLRMCWGNIIFVIIFFTLSATKLPHYGFYGLPGLIVILSVYLSRLESVSVIRSLQLAKTPWLFVTKLFIDVRVFIAFLLITLSFASPLLLHISKSIADPYFFAVVTDASNLLHAKSYVLLFCAGIGVAVLFVRRIIFAVGAASFMVSLMLHIIIVPVVIEAFRGPIRDAALRIQELELDVQEWRLHAPSLSFALGRIVKPAQLDASEFIVTYAKEENRLLFLLSGKRGYPVKLVKIWEQGGVLIVHVVNRNNRSDNAADS